MSEETSKKRRVQKVLLPYYNESEKCIEAGIDEAGRGPMFGPVYCGAVILPKDDSFPHSLMKDSKRFTSEERIMEAYDIIKEHAISYSITSASEKVIDDINILNATHKCMHECVKTLSTKPTQLLVDGNSFKPYMYFDVKKESFDQIPHICIKGGDDKYTPIAAASILAKGERDKYITELCDKYSELHENYGIRDNKGYGTEKHMKGINEHGITAWHRRTFGICKKFT